MKIQQPIYKQFGEKSIVIEWQSVINEKVLQDILRFKQIIIETKKVEDIIVGYNSLTLKFSKHFSDFAIEVKQLQELYNNPKKIKAIENYIWEIPVCYDIEFGVDLKELSEVKKLPIEQIIELHKGSLYTVFFIGFLPGFLYLGGLDEVLHTPRKSNPRLRVAKGSVAIGGKQTGVYPQESAGGWNIIGRTPIMFFEVEKEMPCFAKSGDKIQFVAISKEEYYLIAQKISEHNYQIKKTKINA